MAANLAKEVFSGVSGVVTKYGPDVIDMTFWVVRIDAAQSIVTGLFFLVVGICAWKLCRHMYKLGMIEADKTRGDPSPYWFAMCASFIATVGSALIATITLLSVWTWIAMSKPELYLAKKAYDTVFEAVKKK